MNVHPLRMFVLFVLVAGFWASMLSPAKAISGADRVRLGDTIIPNGSVMPEYSAGSVTFGGTTMTGSSGGPSPSVTRIGHNWDAQPSRMTRLSEGYKVQVGGQQIDWTRRSIVPPGAIMKAAAIAAKTLTPISIGVELWDLFNEVRVRPGTCAEGGLPSSVSDLLCFDAGTDEVTQVGDCWKYTQPGVPPATCQPTPQAAADELATHLVSGITMQDWQYGTCWERQNFVGTASGITWQQRTAGYSIHNGCNTFGAWSSPSSGIAFSTAQQMQCPASIDFSDPSQSIPEGLPPGADGKCRTGRYNVPMPPVDAAQRVEQYAPPNGEALKRLAEDALARGFEIPEASPESGSGPTSVPGTPTTTTTQNPDGTTKTVTKTPTVNYTYNGDTINYTITTVTVTNNAGDITTTTEGTVPEETDACKAAPDSLGCSKMGAPGTDAPAWQVRDVVFTPEDLGIGAGSCPAPESWDVFGINLTWGYEPICDVAPFIRFALLAFAGIGAISVVIRETNA